VAQPTTKTGLDSHCRPQTQELKEWLLYNKLKGEWYQELMGAHVQPPPVGIVRA